MASIILDQESVRNGCAAKRQPPSGSPRKIRKQTPAKPRRHRPCDILVFPPPPLAEDIIIVRLAQEAAFLPSPRLHRSRPPPQRRLPARPRPPPLAAAQKRPRILLSTKNFKWVKTDDAVWVKVPLAPRKRRIILKTKRTEKGGASR